MQKAIDISNWQGDLPSSVYRAWVEAGVKTVILGTSGGGGGVNPPNVYRQQHARASGAGLNVEAYLWLWWGTADEVAVHVNAKLDLIESVGTVPRVWIDCEDTNNIPGPEDVVGLIALARDIIRGRGHEPGIYTGSWWWVPHTANAVGFGNLPLWLADYDGQENLESRLLPMGDWVQLYRKQYSETGELGGVYPLDLNCERTDEPVQLQVAAPPEVVQTAPEELRATADAMRQMGQNMLELAGAIERSRR